MDQERMYFEKVMSFLHGKLIEAEQSMKKKYESVVAERGSMWEEGPRQFIDSYDLDSQMDNTAHLLMYLNEINLRTARYDDAVSDSRKLLRMQELPYFARIDFTEEGYDSEQIYIGLNNLMNDNTLEIYVYDWRSPIAGMYYNFELGKSEYDSPDGIIKGEMTLKRQYKIKDRKIVYYFDSSISIGDEILKDALSRNATAHMRNIVETIQMEQNKIIRDMGNDLLIVQGVAGSGKTSIALHRVAYLLYNVKNNGQRLKPDNILIISPNRIFNRYISQVLPELGEENVGQTTFDEIAANVLGKTGIQTRASFLEGIARYKSDKSTSPEILALKCSRDYIRMLDGLIDYYIRNELNFEDVYYHGKIIAQKNMLKTEILNDKLKTPIVKKLSRLEMKLISRIEDDKKIIYKKILDVVFSGQRRAFEEEDFAQHMAKRDENRFINNLRKFTAINPMELYSLLYKKDGLLLTLAEKLKISLPNNIKSIIKNTKNRLADGALFYEDVAGLLYVKLKLEGCKQYSSIKHVVIDEAQDYYPLHYAIFNILFGSSAKYTILGDYHQSLEKKADFTVYKDIEDNISHNKSLTLSLNKSYRSSVEITAFANKLIDASDAVAFERNEEAPEIIICSDKADTVKRVTDEISKLKSEGFNSIAIICKTECEAKSAAMEIEKLGIKITDLEEDGAEDIVAIASYMAKGLEFDAVIIYNASDENYNTDFDRRLLYAACTRALHRLKLFSTGRITRLL